MTPEYRAAFEEYLRTGHMGDIAASEAGGSFIPDAVVDAIYAAALRPSPFIGMFPPPRPLTRRERIRLLRRNVRDYLHHLGLALVDRCDRDRGA